MRYVEDSLHLEGIVMPHVLECIVKTLKAIVVIPDEDIKRKDSRFHTDMGSRGTVRLKTTDALKLVEPISQRKIGIRKK